MNRKTSFAFAFLAVLIAGIMLITGCGGNGNSEPTGKPGEDYRKDGFAFRYNNTDIYMEMNVDLILSGLGEYEDYFESTSCAFEGLDKQYTYAHFLLCTYPDQDKDLVSQIVLRDDLVATPEGVSIGDSRDKVLEKYGGNYQESEGMCTYSKGNSSLQFLFDEDNIVTSIQYKNA